MFPMQRYPNPRGYVAWVKQGKAVTATGRQVSIWWNSIGLDAEAFQREVWLALDKRINDRGGLTQVGRKDDADYQVRLQRDCRAVRDRVQKRIRVYQFETPDIRKRFAHLLSRYDD